MYVWKVNNSNHMEPESMRQCLAEIADDGLNVSTLATDRHLMIGSIMKKEYGHVRWSCVLEI